MRKRPSIARAWAEEAAMYAEEQERHKAARPPVVPADLGRRPGRAGMTSYAILS